MISVVRFEILFEGSFSTRIANVETKVLFKIYKNYKVVASFNTPQGTKYEFHLIKWSKTKKGPSSPTTAFSKFHALLLERYGQADKFGSIFEKKEGETTQTIQEYTEEQAINVLKYATYDVFVCIEEIITEWRRSLQNYCHYHCERSSPETYEEYIHLVACQALLDSNYLAPETKFDPVEFCVDKREYNEKVFVEIHNENADNEGDDE